MIAQVVTKLGFESLKQAGKQIGFSAAGAGIALGAITGITMLIPKKRQAASGNKKTPPKRRPQPRPAADPKKS